MRGASTKLARPEAVAANPTVRYAKVELQGKLWSLAFTFNALARSEELSGLNLMLAFRSLGDLSIGQTRALLYAALLKKHPTVTLLEVGELMDFDTLPAVTSAIREALENSMPDAEEKEKENPIDPERDGGLSPE